MPSRSVMTVTASLLSAALLLVGYADAPSQRGSADPQKYQAVQPTSAPVDDVQGRRVEVVAVGDIACPPGDAVTRISCRHEETAALAEEIDPDAVLALGDLQYPTGTLAAFQESYDKSWGRLEDITYPTPGNHEYGDPNAEGYFSYFSERTPGSPGYYAFDLGRWRAYSVNGNCTEIDCREQAEWLRKDLAANPRACALIGTHFPRYSSGSHGNSDFMQRFFRIGMRHGVDVALAGHDHHYERFARMDHMGNLAKRGIMSFVSGAGGKSHYRADGDATGSRYVEDDTFGVLRLVLRPDSFRFGFRGIDESSHDNGRHGCR